MRLHQALKKAEKEVKFPRRQDQITLLDVKQYRACAQQARAADRLDRGDFGSRKRQEGFPDLSMHYSQPATDAQGVSPLGTNRFCVKQRVTMSEGMVIALIGFVGAVLGAAITGFATIAAADVKGKGEGSIPFGLMASIGAAGGLVLGAVLGALLLSNVSSSAQKQNQEQSIDISGIWIGTLMTSGNEYHYELHILQQGNSVQGKSIVWKKTDPVDRVEATIRGTFSDKVLRYDEVEITVPSPRNTQCLVSGELYLVSSEVETLSGSLVKRTDPNRCPDLGSVALRKQK